MCLGTGILGGSFFKASVFLKKERVLGSVKWNCSYYVCFSYCIFIAKWIIERNSGLATFVIREIR